MASNRYQEIAHGLRARLLKGDFLPGDRVPSENELATHHAVSRPTAARALRELVQAGLLERRVGSGTYVRGTGSRRASPSLTFGLLVPGLRGTEILDPICSEVSRVCQENGAAALWLERTDSEDDPVGEADRALDLYLRQPVAGVFFAPLESAADRQTTNVRMVESLRSAGIPTVLLDRDILEFPDRSAFDLVGIDNFQAGLEVARHLLIEGRRRTRFLARPHAPSTTDLRAAGAREALRRAGAIVDAEWQLSGSPTDEAFVRHFIDQHRPDAVICSNDLTAALLIQTLSRLKVSVPDELAVAGFDDVSYSTLLSVELTTMRQPIRAIAAAAVHAMMERLADRSLPPRQILLHAELIVRQSSHAQEATGSTDAQHPPA